MRPSPEQRKIVQCVPNTLEWAPNPGFTPITIKNQMRPTKHRNNAKTKCSGPGFTIATAMTNNYDGRCKHVAFKCHVCRIHGDNAFNKNVPRRKKKTLNKLEHDWQQTTLLRNTTLLSQFIVGLGNAFGDNTHIINNQTDNDGMPLWEHPCVESILGNLLPMKKQQPKVPMHHELFWRCVLQLTPVQNLFLIQDDVPPNLCHPVATNHVHCHCQNIRPDNHSCAQKLHKENFFPWNKTLRETICTMFFPNLLQIVEPMPRNTWLPTFAK